MINDHQTELYIGASSSDVCKLPIDEMLSLNYTSTTPQYILFSRNECCWSISITKKSTIEYQEK
jgi:hypothetical protein